LDDLQKYQQTGDMNQKELERSLSDLPLGSIRYFKSIDSTNNAAAKWAATGAPDLSLVAADEQTRGRGRSGHKWYTYPGAALAFSLILRPNSEEFKDNASIASRHIGLGSLGVSQVMQKHYDLPAKIKWPNDILLNGRKFCGVLAEAQWIGDTLSSVILGIGVNVTTEAIPPTNILQHPATCIENELGYSIDRNSLLRQVLLEIITWREQLMENVFLQAWDSDLAYRGTLVKVSSSNQTNNKGTESDGYILGLDPDGGLRLRTSSGGEVSLRNGTLSVIGEG
jgi:BirA family biotin operon repressor/biotin-[acetyl-CoA-carboxylase] ligase